jgi:hypothetical protein
MADAIPFTACKLLKTQNEKMKEHNLFSVFLGLPQGRHIVHRFCTRGEGFCIAGRDKVNQSGFSET